jgi:hypothetical protein
MDQDLQLSMPRDLSRVDVTRRSELRYWRQKFGVDDDLLKEAVRKVGPVVRDVEKFLCRKALNRLFGAAA